MSKIFDRVTDKGKDESFEREDLWAESLLSESLDPVGCVRYEADTVVEGGHYLSNTISTYPPRVT